MTNFIEKHNLDGSVEYVHKDAEELIRLGQQAEAGVDRIEMSPAQLAESLLIEQRNAAKEYLASTDWYAARLAETGSPSPPAVLDLRQQARATLSS